MMAILARAVLASLLDGAQTRKGFRGFRGALSRKYARMVLLVDGGLRTDWLSSRRRVGGQYGPHAFKARMVPRSAGFFFGSPAGVLFRKYLAMKSPQLGDFHFGKLRDDEENDKGTVAPGEAAGCHCA
ncbi:hypothetical protein [Cupriavidus sp. GA3-3]|uniref:hypothetical protein n=1 Tax=Cupriavidus sp. GA3-3 TaxID=1229514 RepID=UPI0011839084|nr:hypothetical protein [Cupriavidus sp. GA3-3]